MLIVEIVSVAYLSIGCGFWLAFDAFVVPTLRERGRRLSWRDHAFVLWFWWALVLVDMLEDESGGPHD